MTIFGILILKHSLDMSQLLAQIIIIKFEKLIVLEILHEEMMIIILIQQELV
jgi:hypothetical protein